MKKNTNSKILLTLVLLVIMFPTNSNISVEARKNHHKKSKSHKHQKQRNANGNHTNPQLPPYDAYPTQASIFDVMSFGAKGDGLSDDSRVKKRKKNLYLFM